MQWAHWHVNESASARRPASRSSTSIAAAGGISTSTRSSSPISPASPTARSTGNPISARSLWRWSGRAIIGSIADLDLAHAAEACSRPRPSESGATASKPLDQKLAGALVRNCQLEPGAEQKVTFVLAWHFPNLRMDRLPGGRFYATRFYFGRREVAEHVAEHFPVAGRPNAAVARHLVRLDAALLVSRSHVHQYLDAGHDPPAIGSPTAASTAGKGWAAARARAPTSGIMPRPWPGSFPRSSATLRERVDFGLAFNPATGAIGFRAEFDGSVAVDGQSGTILRAYREHQMSPDSAFLQRNWPQIKKALEYLDRPRPQRRRHPRRRADEHARRRLVRPDRLAQLALRRRARGRRAKWRAKWETRPSPPRPGGSPKPAAAISTASCSTASITSKPRPRIMRIRSARTTAARSTRSSARAGRTRSAWAACCPPQHTRAALASLWRYNFTPDVGPYRAANKPGRWYAMPGEGGLIMCTCPAAVSKSASQPGLRFLLQRVHDRLRVSGRRAHDLGRDGRARPGRHPRDPRPLSRRPPQPVERSRVRRSLRPGDGQLRSVSGRLRLRIPRPAWAPGLRPAAHARRFPRPVHGGRGLGHIPSTAGRRRNSAKRS